VKLSKLFIASAVFNLLGGIILIFGANQLSSWLHLGSSSNFLWHLLGACSFSLAVLSFYAIKFKPKESIKAAVITIMTFNGLSAIVSIWAIAGGINPLVWINTTVHVIFFVLFLYFGLIKFSQTS
jgi:hypothetical protein